MTSNLKIGFLGAGKMAAALARGFIRSSLAEPAAILASDCYEGARVSFAKETGGGTTPSNLEVLKSAGIIILAVKPAQVDEVLSEVHSHFTHDHLLVSIAAGVPLSRIESALGNNARVIRVMPNTPALVGASASAYALGRCASPHDAQLARELFSAVGLAFEVKEGLLDAVTGLSGSGPAYVALIIEALSDGGVAAGLPRDVATTLAAQTVLGTARMVLETGLHPGTLKDMVTSPGGTTIEGLHELERAGVRSALISAVRAATDKSRKLGEG